MNASQWDIAKALNVNQSTVSRALRGDRNLPEALRERVRKAAEKLGYHENPFIKVLMNQVRSKRKLQDLGVIALILDVRAQRDWNKHAALMEYYHGAVHRAGELGYHLDVFFMNNRLQDFESMDRLLQARGIRGVVMGYPWQEDWGLQVKWSRYACVVTGWDAAKRQKFDLITHDYSANMIIAFDRLARLGYARVGVIFNPLTFPNRAVRWMPAYLECQDCLPKERRIPYFLRNRAGGGQMESFVRWLDRWKPEALLTADFHVVQWLEALNMRVPKKIGLAGMGSLPGERWSGIMQDHALQGVRSVEQVAAKIERNEYGPSPHPSVLLISGHWVAGKTLRRIGAPVPPPVEWDGDIPA